MPEMHSDHFREELIAGLAAAQAAIPPKYLYDEIGCRLFDLITRLPEYYPTRIERSLIARHAGAIREAAGTGVALIDLGAGNCEKARRLFPALQPKVYVAVDIATEYLDRAVAAMRGKYPRIEMRTVAADIEDEISVPQLNGMKRLFFYPGSSIGNFDPEQASSLLRRIRSQCGTCGGLLVGVDLTKDGRTLQAAYNDSLGVTAAFNLNVLNHANALLGADFRLSSWRHRAVFVPHRSRIEMHLDAVEDVAVTWPEGGRSFHAGESIHTENSYKYRVDDFAAMLDAAGFRDIRAWTDDRSWFALCYAGV